MSEDGIKQGIEIINRYFESMKKFKSDVDYFTSECTTVIRDKVAVVKIYGLAFNLAWSLRYTINRMIEYENVLTATLLYDYWNENNNILEGFKQMSENLVDFINNSLDTLSISIKGTDNIENEITEDEDDDIERLISDNQYLLSLSQELSTNGPKLFHVIVFYLNQAIRILVEIKNIRLSRDDVGYQHLFEKEYKEFLTTDNWNDLKEGFVNTIISVKYRGIEPTIEQLQALRDDEYDHLQDLRKELGSFDAYINDYGKLAKYLVNRDIKHNVNNPISELFSCFGRMKIIEDWIKDIEDEAPLVEPYEYANPSDAITFSEKLSEKRFKSLWPKIEELYTGRKAIDWVCLYHVVLYRNYVSCDDFKLFIRWLSNTADRELMSDVNLRQIKMSYWAKEAKKLWTIDGLHKWRNSAKADSQYRDYELLCDQINEIIK